MGLLDALASKGKTFAPAPVFDKTTQPFSRVITIVKDAPIIELWRPIPEPSYQRNTEQHLKHLIAHKVLDRADVGTLRVVSCAIVCPDESYETVCARYLDKTEKQKRAQLAADLDKLIKINGITRTLGMDLHYPFLLALDGKIDIELFYSNGDCATYELYSSCDHDGSGKKARDQQFSTIAAVGNRDLAFFFSSHSVQLFRALRMAVCVEKYGDLRTNTILDLPAKQLIFNASTPWYEIEIGLNGVNGALMSYYESALGELMPLLVKNQALCTCGELIAALLLFLKAFPEDARQLITALCAEDKIDRAIKSAQGQKLTNPAHAFLLLCTYCQTKRSNIDKSLNAYQWRLHKLTSALSVCQAYKNNSLHIAQQFVSDPQVLPAFVNPNPRVFALGAYKR